MNSYKSRLLTASIGALVAFTVSPIQAQTFWQNGDDGITWEDATNWTAGIPTASTAVVINVQPSGGPNIIGVDNGGSGVAAASITFGSALNAPISIRNDAAGDILTVGGVITNSSTSLMTFNIPVSTPLTGLATTTYNGGTGGLDFGTLTVNLTKITTSNVTVTGGLVFTINSNTSFGTIGPVTASGANIQVVGNYTTNATLAANAGDLFKLVTGTGTGDVGTTAGALPTFADNTSGTGLIWIKTIAQKGILFVEPAAGGNIIKTGVTLPIDADSEFNAKGTAATDIEFEGGELVTNNAGDISGGTAFSTTRTIAVDSTNGTIAATTGTSATYGGVISNGTGTGTLTIGDSTDTGNVILAVVNTYGSASTTTTVADGTLTIGNTTAGSATGAGIVSLSAGTNLAGDTATADIAGQVKLNGTNTLSTSTGTLTIGGGLSVLTGSNTISTGTIAATTTQSAGTTLTVNGTLSGSDSLTAGATTLTGTGSVGAVTLNGTGNIIGGTGSTLTASGITVNNANNTVASGGTVTVSGTTTQAAGSALTVSGTLASTDSLTAGATSLTGAGSVGAVTLNGGGNTISGTGGGLTTGGITVNGTGANTVSSGTVIGNATQSAGTTLTVTGTLNGTDSLAAGATTLTGAGTVGAVTLHGTGNTITGTGTGLTTGGVTVNGTTNTLTGKVNGAITQANNSTLSVSGNGGSDTVGTGATLTGTATGASLGAVTLAGTDTLSSTTGTLTTTGITVGGLGNTLSAGTVAGNITFNGTSALAINGTATGTVAVGNGATLSGTGTAGVTTVTTGGAINLANGTIGTLTIAGGSSITGGALTFDVSGTSTNDSIAVKTGGAAGLLTIGNGTQTTITIDALTGTLVNTTYNLLTFSSGSTVPLGDFNLTTTTLDGKTLSLVDTSTALELMVATPSIPPTSTTYSLSATNARVMVNFSTTVSATITNTGVSNGTVNQDSLDYTGLGLASSSGTLSAVTPTSGTNVGPNNGTSSGTATLSGLTTTGDVTLTPSVGTVTNHTIGGAATAGATTTGTIDVVQNRVVTANSGNTVAFGRVIAGTAVSQSISLTSTGDDADNTRVKVGNAAADVNGIGTSGGNTNTIFNGSTFDTRNVGGTFSVASPGDKSGILSLTTTGEGLANEAPINVNVAYTADAVNNRIESSTSVNLGRVLVGQTTGPQNTTISSAPNDDATLTRTTLAAGTQNATVANGTVSLNNTTAYQFGGPVNDAVNSTPNGSVTVTGSFTTTGNQSGTASYALQGEGLAGEVVNPVGVAYSADAVQQRTITNGASTSLGVLHNGATVSTTTSAFTSNASNLVATSVSVAGTPTTGSPDAFGISLTGTATALNGTTTSGTRTLTGTVNDAGGGAIGTTFGLAVTTLENGGAGLTGEGPYSNVGVQYSGFVYTGQGVWNAAGSGTWGAVSATPANWTANGGTPGLDANFTSTDSATFGNSIGATAATVSLSGDSPSLNTVTFDNTMGGSYTIAQGTGGTLKLNGGANPAAIVNTVGNNTISAPISLTTNANVSVAAGQLTISGAVSGANGLSISGPGTTVLSGTSTYSGPTTLTSGILNITGSTLSTGAVAINGGTLAGTGSTGSVTLAAGANINLQNGSIGTLTVAGLNLSAGSAGTPNALSFDIGAGSTGNLDKIVDNGSLTLGGASGTTINIGNVSGTPMLTNGTYTLISSTSAITGSAGDLALGTTTLDGKQLSLSIVGDSIDLTIANISNSYTLTATAANPRIIVGTGTTTITSTITNTGAPGTITYTGLDANSSAGTISGGTLPKNGGPLAAGGGSDSGTRTFSQTGGEATGNVTITPVVGTVTNTNGTAVLAGTNTATVDIVANRVVDASTVNFGRVLTGLTVTGTSTLTSPGADNLFTRIQVGQAGPDANGISTSGGNVNTVFDGTKSDTRTVSGTFAAGNTGNINGTLTINTTGEGLTGEVDAPVTLDYTADAVNKRTITVTGGATTNLGTVHSGTVINTTSNTFTSTGTNATTTSVQVAAGSGVTDANGIKLTGAATTFNGSTSPASDTRTFSGTLTSATGGTVANSFNLGVTTLENGGAGLTGEGTYAPVTLGYTAFVYTGKGVWNATGGGTWGSIVAPTNWTANGGAPGLDANFTTTDSATFGNSIGNTQGATVTLSGDSPSLNNVTFNNTMGGTYIIAQGGSGTLKLNGGATAASVVNADGNNSISAPVELDSNASTAVANGDTLTLSGPISEAGGSHSLTVTGPGTTLLTAANSYTGGTNLSSGALDLTGAGTLGAAGTALNVGGGTLDLGTTTQTVGAVNVTGASTIQNGALTTAASYTFSAPSGMTTVSAALNGTGSLTKSGGGALALNNANNFSGGATITGGMVAVGNLGALGTGNVSMSGGSLQTGNGVHQINVAGTYTQTGGTLVLNLTGTTPGASPGYEFLNVGGGTGVANLGGALVIDVNPAGTPVPYVPVIGDTFTFVQAGTINGGFTSVSTNLFSLSVTQQGAGVIIRQMPFTVLPVPYTANELSIAQYIDTSFQSGANSPAFQALVSALDGLAVSGAPTNLIPDAFSQLSQEKFANFTTSTVFNNAVFNTELFDTFMESGRSADGDFQGSTGQIDSSGLSVVGSDVDPSLGEVSSRMLAWSPAPIGHGMLSDTPDPVMAGMDTKQMAPAPAPPTGNNFNAFVTGNVVLAQGFSQTDTPHSDSTTGAVTVGGDYRITPHLRAGALFSYGHTDADLDEMGSKATVDSYAPGAYVSFADHGWYVNALGSYGFDNFTEDRHVAFDGLSGVAHGAPSGDQIVGNLDGGYDFHLNKLTLGPTLGVQYTHLDVDSFNENGSAVFDENVNRSETDSLRSRLGGHASYAFQSGTIIITPHLDASWQHEFMDQSRGITSQFDSVGAGSFIINTQNPSRDSALIDGGLSADLNGQVSVFGDYLIQAGQDNYFGQSVQVGVKVGF